MGRGTGGSMASFDSKLAGRVIRVDMTGVDRVDGNPFGITTFPWPRLLAYFEE
jgi:hypothetical protein